MENIDIKSIDKNMSIKDDISSNVTWFNPLEQPFSIYGFPWIKEDKIYKRLKSNLNLDIPVTVDNLSYHTAGGQIKFKTDSSIIAIKVELRNAANMYHMAATGQCGFDLYIGYGKDEKFCSTVKYDSKNTFYQYELYNNSEDKKMKDILINFPLYEGVKAVYIGIENNSSLLESEKFKYDKRIVFYGTSITQGGCASRPGMCYTNIISRKLNAECINLGFAGNGKGEKEMAEVINTIENKGLVVIDYEANCITTELYKKTLPKFIEVIRNENHNLPIVVLTRAPFSKDLFYSQTVKDRIDRSSFKKQLISRLQEAGDHNLYLIDMMEELGDRFNECTVDGVHPTDYGFALIAEVLEQHLRKIILS